MKKSPLLAEARTPRTLSSTTQASLKKTLFALALGVSLTGFFGTGEASVITTQPDWDFSEISFNPFGETSTATYGQTFTVTGPDTMLESFSFWYDDYLNTDFVDFAAYVYEWDGTKATGNALFASSMVSTTDNDNQDGMEQFEFTTGGLQLVAGVQYVAFTSASLFFDEENGTAGIGGIAFSDDYAGGAFVFLNNGNDASEWTTDDWEGYYDADLGIDVAFEAVFSPVPVPAAAWLFGSGLLGLIGMARRKKAA